MGCGGERVCGPVFADPAPACGTVSYYGQEVACCDGLALRCGAQTTDGMCDSSAGGYGLGLASVPMCIACGDGTCEPPFETACSCPEDCAK
jgi:hypothetical protein